MKVNMHTGCHGVRGIKMFNCVKCGRVAHNYYNGINICPECLFKGDLCAICGKAMSDEKPISSEENTNIEEDIYSKKYNIYEILTLIPNIPKDSKFKCSLNYNESWYPCVTEKTLVDEFEGNDSIDEYYELKDILEATYTIVKPVEIEEVKEKWVEIKNSRELCHNIVKDNTIKITDEKFTEEDDGHVWKIENYGTIIFKPPFTKDVIDKLYDYKHMPRYKIEYLEEN